MVRDEQRLSGLARRTIESSARVDISRRKRPKMFASNKRELESLSGIAACHHRNDADLKVTAWNSAAERIFEWSAQRFWSTLSAVLQAQKTK